MAYLVSKYAKNDSLYPKDPKERAMVDQRMYFDANLFANLLKCYVRIDLRSEINITTESAMSISLIKLISPCQFPFGCIDSFFPHDSIMIQISSVSRTRNYIMSVQYML